MWLECGELTKRETSEKRYKVWFERYMAQKYVFKRRERLGSLPKSLFWPFTEEERQAYWVQREAYFNSEKAVEEPLLTGYDFYGLRCAMLHTGTVENKPKNKPKPQRTLDRFEFKRPEAHKIIHCNSSGDRLQLQVDIFCEQICIGAERWFQERGSDQKVIERRAELLEIS